MVSQAASVKVSLILSTQGEDGSSITNIHESASIQINRAHLLPRHGQLYLGCQDKYSMAVLVVWSGSFDPLHVILHVSLLPSAVQVLLTQHILSNTNGFSGLVASDIVLLLNYLCSCCK